MGLFKDLGCTNQSGELTVPDCVKVGGLTATDIINSFIPTTLPYTIDGQISILGSSLPTTVSQENTQTEWRKYQAKAVNLSGYIDDEKNKPIVKRNTTNVIDSSKGDVLSFNGTGGIDLSTHSDYNFSNDCTIELYVKFNSYAPVGDASPINIIGTTGPNGWTTGEWGLNFGTQNWNTSKTNRLLLWVYSGVNTPKLYSSYALSLNTWYHIALVQSGNTINLFINGILDATATGKLTMNNITSLTSFGRLNGYVYKLHITKFAKYDRDFIPDNIISDSNTIFHLRKIHSGKLFINNKEQTFLSTTKNKPDFFGDGSNITTYLFSNNANDARGTYNGNASNITYSLGALDNCANFNGVNSTITTTLTPTNFGTRNSVSLWIKHTPTAGYTPLISFGDTNFGLIGSSFTFHRPSVTQVYGGTLPSDTWSHIVFVNNTGGSTMTATNVFIYLNGVKVTLTQSLTGTPLFNANMTIASLTSFPSSHIFSGSMDNIRVFNRTLTDAEVVKLYEEDTTTFAIEYGRDRTLSSSVQGTVDKVYIDTWTK